MVHKMSIRSSIPQPLSFLEATMHTYTKYQKGSH